MNNPNEILIEMGKRIALRRKALMLSQEELAEKVEVSAQMISTAERGTKAIRPENLIKLSAALGVSADYLLTGEISENNFGFISRQLEGKTPEQIKLIEQIINNCVQLCDK